MIRPAGLDPDPRPTAAEKRNPLFVRHRTPGMNVSVRGQIGIVLMVVGTLAFLPAITPRTGTLQNALVLVGAAVLTYGTYLFGTDTGGRPV